MASAGLLAIPTAATASLGGTKVTVFHAFTASGRPTLPTKSLTGYCWTGSLTADRDDAWRCLVGNGLYDPCFSSAAAPAVVLCPNYKLTTDIEIHLTRPLPLKQADRGGPSVHIQPWLIELEASTVPNVGPPRCEFSSGATNVIDGKRLNYFCTGGAFSTMGLWGFPNREMSEWFILMTPTNAKSLSGGTDIAIRHAWT